MKTIFYFLTFTLLSTVLFNGCVKDKCDLKSTYYQFDPEYMTLEEFRQPIKMGEPRTLEVPGQIYYYKHYLLINEMEKGIHVYDNIDASNPTNIGFIDIPGNRDLAIKDDVLFADSYIDLVAVNISDMANVRMENRIEDIFQNFFNLTDKGIQTGWKKTEVTVEIPCTDYRYKRDYYFEGNVLYSTDESASSVNSTVPGNVGTGGSTARFTIAKEHLYTLGVQNLTIFNITDATTPVVVTDVTVPWRTMETIFPYKDYIFLGANNGVYIFDNTVPSNLHQITQFTHARSCDPVYVKDDVAFVTLNGNSRCGSNGNQLDVLNVENISNPTLIKSFNMTDPHGLSISGNTLYLCDGIDGLEVYDITKLNEITSHRVAHLHGFEAMDVIALPNNLLLLMTKDGIYQFDATDRTDLVELSKIEIKKS